MYMRVSVVMKFYDAKIYKNIYNRMHILFIFSRSLFVLSATSPRILNLFFYTETTQKINKFHVKKYSRIKFEPKKIQTQIVE
jgi:hypothetical protein